MASFKEKQALLLEEVHTLPPLSPLSQCINSSSLSIPIIGVYELGAPLNRSQTATFLQDIFIPINDRFSSVIITDKKGMQRWKKVEVDIDEHILIPTFPSGLSREDYDDYTNEYLSKITMDPLPENRPLWNVHVIPYPSTNAEATLVFKINHAIGDGYSLIGALFSCLKRADDPSLPLTFPSMSSRMMQGTGGLSKWSRLCSFLTVCVNTLTDSARSVLFGTFLEDDKTAIRSGLPGVEYEPISISSITFSLDDLGRIQSKFGGVIKLS